MRGRHVLLVSLVCLAAGCTAVPGISPESPTSPAPTATGNGTAVTTAVTTAPATGTGTATRAATTAPGTAGPTPTPADFAVEYLVTGGSFPDAFQSVTVEFEVAFAQRADDLDYCIGGLFSGKYEPTATPLPTPAGDCRSVSGITVNLTGLDGTRSLGPFVAPGRFDGAHALVATDFVAVYENGTRVTDIDDIDFVVHRQEGRDPGYYGVQIGVTGETAPGEPWRYAVVQRSFDPGVAVGTPTPAGNATASPAGNGTASNETTRTATTAPTETPA
ncbi:MAG: hypothetical protein V5A44_04055 [Haloarculaceae archaeon]